jgi:Leucine-rich repeat (LRR) protein
MIKDVEMRAKIPKYIKSVLEKTATDEKLNLGAKGLNVIDVTNHLNLKELDLSTNQLSAVDLRSNKLLTTLYLSYNQIKAIDLSNNTNLVHLDL